MTDEMEEYYDECPKEQGPFYCTICHKNTVDALNGFDTCEDCLQKV